MAFDPSHGTSAVFVDRDGNEVSHCSFWSLSYSGGSALGALEVSGRVPESADRVSLYFAGNQRLGLCGLKVRSASPCVVERDW